MMKAKLSVEAKIVLCEITNHVADAHQVDVEGQEVGLHTTIIGMRIKSHVAEVGLGLGADLPVSDVLVEASRGIVGTKPNEPAKVI